MRSVHGSESYQLLSNKIFLYQTPAAQLPEAFLGGFNVAHGVMGTIEVVAEELDV